MSLPDNPNYRNHVAGPHAGAMWTLAESASGALVFANFGDLMAEVTPFPVESTIRFLKVAFGPVTAVATLGEGAATAVETMRGGTRPEFDVEIELFHRRGRRAPRHRRDDRHVGLEAQPPPGVTSAASRYALGGRTSDSSEIRAIGA